MSTLSHLKPLIEAKARSQVVDCDTKSLISALGYDTAENEARGYDDSTTQSCKEFNGLIQAVIANPLLGEYLAHLTPLEVYEASGVRILPLQEIRDEIQQLAPSTRIFPYGYLPFASSIGGNSICYHPSSGKVIWADRSAFGENSLRVKEQGTGRYGTEPYTSENVLAAVIPLSDNFTAFLTDLLHDRLNGRLDALD